MCDLGEFINDKVLMIVPLTPSDLQECLLTSLEVYPFYCNCLLLPAMAVERWLLVCRPTQADSVLNSRYKYLFYGGIAFLAILLPSYLVFDSAYVYIQRPTSKQVSIIHIVPFKNYHVSDFKHFTFPFEESVELHSMTSLFMSLKITLTC